MLIGVRLVPQFMDRGHEVIGNLRSPGSAERIPAAGDFRGQFLMPVGYW